MFAAYTCAEGWCWVNVVSALSSGGKPNDGICNFGVRSFCRNRAAERVKSSYYQNQQIIPTTHVLK